MDGTQLAGPATGDYNGGQKMSSQKRKRDKAQEQLRTRMRQRINGNGSSSTLLHTKRRSSVLDRKGDSSLSAGMRHSSSVDVTPSDLQGNNFWRTQQERYNTLTGIQHIGSSRHPRISTNQTVPLQELVDRVLHRKEQNFGLGSKVSPMTIRAYKPPVAPYAIQQSSHVKKIVKMRPIQRADRDDKGPFVLVLQRNENEETQAQRGHRRLRSRLHPGPSDPEPEGESLETSQPLPPLIDNDRVSSELKTWRPALDSIHQPSVLPEAEDRSVTNYRLQLQHANKLAEARFDFHHDVSTNQTVEEMTMQTLNPLPPIQSVYSAGDATDANSNDKAGTKFKQEKQSQIPKGNGPNVDRTTSKTEILNLKRAQKEAKRQKQAESEEFTLLRTRRRFTNKTKQFKNELERARQLSAIQEDRSTLSSARLGRLSGRHASSSSASSSSTSLNSINESNISIPITFNEDCSESDSIDNESTDSSMQVRGKSEQSCGKLPLAPPTTPSFSDEQVDSSVIMNVDVMNSRMEEPASDESFSDDSTEKSETQSRSTISNDDVVIRDPGHSQSMEDEDITEGMMWVEGDIPFPQNSPTHKDPAVEHAR